jgi:hypothetical protein
MISVLSFDTTGGLLVFVAPSQYLGDHSAAAGGNLTFRFSAVAGPASFQPVYDLSSGTVLLSGDSGISATPEPGTMALGICGLAFVVWRRKSVYVAHIIAARSQ